VAAGGKVMGSLVPTGLRPAFVHKFEKHGLTLPSDLFNAAASYPRVVAQ
jgi:hypothetical protein